MNFIIAKISNIATGVALNRYYEIHFYCMRTLLFFLYRSECTLSTYGCIVVIPRLFTLNDFFQVLVLPTGNYSTGRISYPIIVSDNRRLSKSYFLLFVLLPYHCIPTLLYQPVQQLHLRIMIRNQ